MRYEMARCVCVGDWNDANSRQEMGEAGKNVGAIYSTVDDVWPKPPFHSSAVVVLCAAEARHSAMAWLHSSIDRQGFAFDDALSESRTGGTAVRGFARDGRTTVLHTRDGAHHYCNIYYSRRRRYCVRSVRRLSLTLPAKRVRKSLHCSVEKIFVSAAQCTLGCCCIYFLALGVEG